MAFGGIEGERPGSGRHDLRADWPFMARAEERDFLDETLRRPRTAGRSAGVVVVAAAGVGKTRLVRETAVRTRSRGLETLWALLAEAANSGGGGDPAATVELSRAFVGLGRYEEAATRLAEVEEAVLAEPDVVARWEYLDRRATVRATRAPPVTVLAPARMADLAEARSAPSEAVTWLASPVRPPWSPRRRWQRPDLMGPASAFSRCSSCLAAARCWPPGDFSPGADARIHRSRTSLVSVSVRTSRLCEWSPPCIAVIGPRRLPR